MSTPQTRVVGYVRVSTSEQATEGVSLEAQRVKLEAYALAMELELVTIHEDAGQSAKSLKRDGLQGALADLEAGRADGLLICKLDRLTRSVVDLGTLLEGYFASRFSLLSVADSIDTRTAAGRLCLNLLVSVSQWEREAIGERTRDALAHLRSQGVAMGGAALGWTYSKDTDSEGRRVVVEDDDEIETAARIATLHKQGLSLRKICDRLYLEGRPTKRGGAWRPATVRKVLMREVVYGCAA